MKSGRVIFVTILFWCLYFVLDESYFRSCRTAINDIIDQISISHLITYSIFGIPLLVGLFLMHGKRITEALGMNRSLIQGLGFSLICTLPMFIGFAFTFDFNNQLSSDRIVLSVLAAAFFEEVFYRGYLFGQLFRYSKFGFIPAALVGAVLFGMAHLYQGDTVIEAFGVFGITFLGALLFAWLFAEWEFNIWVPIGMHLFMNLSWEMFNVSNDALGNQVSNIFRVITIALAILLTIRRKKQSGQAFRVNRKTLIVQPKNIIENPLR